MKITRTNTPILIEIGGSHCTIEVNIYQGGPAKHALFLLHDVAGRSGDFDGLVPYLVELGFKVVTFDLPGRGRSTRLSQFDYDVRTYTDVFFAVFKAHASERNSILGQGWSAMLALLFETLLPPQIQLHHLFLFDLPRRWRYSDDVSAQVWAKVARLSCADAAEFATALDAVVPADLPGRDQFLALAGERARTIGDKVSIGVDPVIFDQLAAQSAVVFDPLKAFPVLRANTWLFDGRDAATPLYADLELATSKNGGTVHRQEVLSASNRPWTSLEALAPLLGTIRMWRTKTGAPDVAKSVIAE